MSDPLKHECGVALIRQRRPSPAGLQTLSLLMEKQHNRGQDGAGIAVWRREAEPGTPYTAIVKSNGRNPLAEVLEAAAGFPFTGEIYLGHLRYGTFGGHSPDECHPLLKPSAFRNRALLLAGNFNLTNTRALLRRMADQGHHLTSSSDTTLLLHMIGHELEKDPDRPLSELLALAARSWDGGFLICGVTGSGTAFALRDPAGIRTGFYHTGPDATLVASERPPIQAATGGEAQEIPPGHALVIDPCGRTAITPCLTPRPTRACVFERIYFSRGNDAAIQAERREMGRRLIPALRRAAPDPETAFYSYIPNTALTAFNGLLAELRPPRFGQLIVKDAQFRTFIANAAGRQTLGMHLYDLVYGQTAPADTLVLIDDSIVRGNTLNKCLLPLLRRLAPRKIVIASTAPPVCYPDCYGIDMASLRELVAFRAAVNLLPPGALDHAVAAARADLKKPDRAMENRAAPLYARIGFQALTAEIARLLTPPGFETDFEIVFQTPEDLRAACPNHTGDWYFTGNYPTPGGNRIVNQALADYADPHTKRAY